MPCVRVETPIPMNLWTKIFGSLRMILTPFVTGSTDGCGRSAASASLSADMAAPGAASAVNVGFSSADGIGSHVSREMGI